MKTAQYIQRRLYFHRIMYAYFICTVVAVLAVALVFVLALFTHNNLAFLQMRDRKRGERNKERGETREREGKER